MKKGIAMALCLIAMSSEALSQEVIMRRPIPTGVSGNNTDNGNGNGNGGGNVDPDDGDDGDIIIPNPGGTTEAVFLAYGTCVAGTMSNVVCGSYEVNGGLISSNGPTDLSQCSAQSPATLGYSRVGALGTRPANTTVISPSNASTAEGTTCGGGLDGNEIKTFYGVRCGAGGITVTTCRQFNVVNDGVSESPDVFSVTQVADENCVQSESYGFDPSYSSSLLMLNLRPAGPQGIETCDAPPSGGLGETIVFDAGSCKYTSTRETDGSTTVEYKYDWDCREAEETQSGLGYNIGFPRSVADSNCINAMQSQEVRDRIVNNHGYNDPQAVDTSCDGSLVATGPLRVDINPESDFDSFNAEEVFFNIDNRGPSSNWYLYTDIVTYEYSYYCHRLGGNIFDNPDFLLMSESDEFNTLVEEHNYSSAIEGENCTALANEALEQILPDVDPTCLEVAASGGPAEACAVSGEVIGAGTGNKEGRIRITTGRGDISVNCARGNFC